jgi:hypothetical protein
MPPKQPKSALSRVLLDKLWEQCNWAHEIWTLRRALIDSNQRKRTLEQGPHFYFIKAVGDACMEYVLLQIAKLHDRAVVAGRVCLTLDYVVEYGGWDETTQHKLMRLKGRLDALDSKIRPARNRLIAHNDLAVALSNQSLGGFVAGTDQRYFRTLQSFVSTAYKSTTGGPCAAFSTLKDDTRLAVAALAASPASVRRRRPK